MSDNKIISERLRIVREGLGINKAEASRRLNLSKIGYCRYELGERIPSAQILEVIAQTFGTSVDYLIGDSDDPASNKIVIEQKANPELYSLVDFAQKADTDTMARIMDYIKKLQGN